MFPVYFTLGPPVPPHKLKLQGATPLKIESIEWILHLTFPPIDYMWIYPFNIILIWDIGGTSPSDYKCGVSHYTTFNIMLYCYIYIQI